MGFYAPENYTPARSLGYLIRRAERGITARAEAAFDDRELNFSQWIALKMIGHGLATNAAAVARAIGHNSGATTRLIDQLEERGLVCRSRECGDRRVIRLKLTDAGNRAVGSEVSRLTSMWNDLLAGFENSEVETLITLLGRLLAALGEEGEIK